MPNEFKGPFLGFRFNGVHSSDLKIVRINTGSRADLLLSPQFKDNTVERTGGVGLHYLNTQILQQTLSINFAYDNLTEEDIRTIKKTYAPEVVGELIFDEMPYKHYTAKISSQPKLSYLVFDEGVNNRLYKGEGAVSFSAYYPYARTPYDKQLLTDYESEWSQSEINEWAVTSGLLQQANMLYNRTITTGSTSENAVTRLYNPGDLNAPLKFKFFFTSDSSTRYLSIQLSVGGTVKQKIILDVASLMPYNNTNDTTRSQTTYIFDSKLKLITNEATGIVCNEIIAAGDFLGVVNESSLSSQSQTLTISAQDCVGTITNIEYDYLYL